MKNKSDKSWTIALCASLAAHAVLAYVVLDAFVDMLSQNLYQPGIARVEQPSSPIYLPEDDNEQTRADVMGEDLAQGVASATSSGEQPMKARQADADQPLLSRDPAGPGFIGDAPSQSTAVPGDGGLPGQPARRPTPVSPVSPPAPVPETPFGIATASADFTHPSVPRPAAPVPPTPPAVAAPATPQPPSEDQAIVSAAPGSTPGVPQPAADPAPMSDSESDPFSKVGTVDFSPGAVEARFGRKVKTTRPRLSLAGKWDIRALLGPTVIFQVETDETGKVTSVEILKSSGSNEIDQPCQVAIYDWWIEPPKDKNGKPMPDVMIWKISVKG